MFDRFDFLKLQNKLVMSIDKLQDLIFKNKDTLLVRLWTQ